MKVTDCLQTTVAFQLAIYELTSLIGISSDQKVRTLWDITGSAPRARNV